MQASEVTQRQWKSVMGTEPWKGHDNVKEGDDYAATFVSHEDAVEYCRKLSAGYGGTYRLPTEAEWEYACRGGTRTAYSFGNSAGQLGQYAWFEDNAEEVDEEYAHRVGQKRSNGFGLYDMHGNVWEWCSDWFDNNNRFRVFRGGSWFSSSDHCRSAYRNRGTPDYRSNLLGFRVARSSVK